MDDSGNICGSDVMSNKLLPIISLSEVVLIKSSLFTSFTSFLGMVVVDTEQATVRTIARAKDNIDDIVILCTRVNTHPL